MSRSSAAASAGTSSGGTSRPFSPSRISSGTPEMLVEMQGRRWLAASTSTLGRPSRSPSSADAAGQHEEVGAAVALQHLLLGQRAAPGDPVGNAEALGLRLQAAAAGRRRRYARTAS